ncbi:MAG TPA: SLC13 family permease [Gammaproteobacteria bacterium]|nr:SLC13 family permease [Gammaproteobacteria bacterium]
MDALPVLTTEMAIVLGVVVLAVVLFATEILRVDVVALLVVTLLGLLIYLPGLNELLEPELLFAGLSSDAVVSIIAVMILGAGLDKTGVMDQVAGAILRYGGHTEAKIVAMVSGTVALISSFMQNVGAASLFVPVVSRISARTRLPMSRLIMPMGFCAILGGTTTMVASSPLIMLNDLLDTSNRGLPADRRMEPFDLFSVAPVGIALVVAGLAYFIVFGRYVLPQGEIKRGKLRGFGTARYMRHVHGINAAVREVEVPAGSPLAGRDLASLQHQYEAKIVALHHAGASVVSPPIEAALPAPSTIAVIAESDELKRFIEAGGLILRPKLKDFRYMLARAVAGIAEVVVPPDSSLIGETVRDLRLREKTGLSLLSIYRSGKAITSALQEVPFAAGDTLIAHTRWEDLARLEKDRNFVVVTADYPRQEQSPYKVALAIAFLAVSLGLILLTDIALPVALMTGAVGMIAFGLLTMDEAYRSISWTTVFLLAGLLPLGGAVEASGLASYIAAHLQNNFGALPVWLLQAVLAVLAAMFTLIISNVGATVLLVPIAVNLAVAVGADPAMFALTVAISTSNSFILPTHQVNALLLGPGGYHVRDFLKAGSLMSLIFLVVSLVMLNILF